MLLLYSWETENASRRFSFSWPSAKKTCEKPFKMEFENTMTLKWTKLKSMIFGFATSNTKEYGYDFNLND